MVDDFLEEKLSINILDASDKILKELIDVFIEIGVKRETDNVKITYEFLQKAKRIKNNYIYLRKNILHASANIQTTYATDISTFINIIKKRSYNIETSDIDSIFGV